MDMKILASNFIRTAGKCHSFGNEGEKGSGGECTEMSAQTLESGRVACPMCCFPSLSLLLNLHFELFFP